MINIFDATPEQVASQWHLIPDEFKQGGPPTGSGSKSKTTKVRVRQRYAEVAGRLMLLAIGTIPDHGLPPEELGIQLFFLGVSMKPVIRSLQLYTHRAFASARCTKQECPLTSDDE